MLSRHSKIRIQTALHPANVQAQHEVAIKSHASQLTSVIDIADVNRNRRKLTSSFDDAQNARFFKAHQVLNTELALLDQAEAFATEVPHLVEDAHEAPF